MATRLRPKADPLYERHWPFPPERGPDFPGSRPCPVCDEPTADFYRCSACEALTCLYCRVHEHEEVPMGGQPDVVQVFPCADCGRENEREGDCTCPGAIVRRSGGTFAVALANTLASFPGLLDLEREVNGGDLVEALTPYVRGFLEETFGGDAYRPLLRRALDGE